MCIKIWTYPKNNNNKVSMSILIVCMHRDQKSSNKGERGILKPNGFLEKKKKTDDYSTLITE